jgi:hypothetical protein
MYGTIARLKAKPGALELLAEYEQRRPPGFINSYIFKMDSKPDELWMVVLFKDRETYFSNAESPIQNEEYQQIRELLLEDPEWHDGTIVFEAGH